MALVPVTLAAAVWRRLERERPPDEQGALAVGAATGIGFALSAWLAALVGRVVVLAAVSRGSGVGGAASRIVPVPLRGTVGTLVALRPNPAAILGLGLLWGVGGGLGAAFVWASGHDAEWRIGGTGQDAAGEPPPEKP